MWAYSSSSSSHPLLGNSSTTSNPTHHPEADGRQQLGVETPRRRTWCCLGPCIVAAASLSAFMMLRSNGESASASFLELQNTSRSLLREQRGNRYFVWLADAHIDPFYGTPSQACQTANLSQTAPNHFGIVGCDPPPLLMESLLDALADVVSVREREPEFVLYSGDFARHRVEDLEDPYGNVTRIVKDVASMITNRFPGLPPERFVAGTLGNTDSFRDYGLRIEEDKHQNPWLVNIGRELADAGIMKPASIDTYSFAGFEEFYIGGLVILSIDTLMYSPHLTPRPENLKADPYGQFAWLSDRLKAAHNARHSVWIIGHIPPGLESFAFTELWQPQYVQRYLDIVRDPSLGSCIAAQLFGHVHTDEFRVVPGAPPGLGAVLLSASISPVYESFPSFRLVEYSPEGSLVNYQVYYAELSDGSFTATGAPQWRLGYDAASAYRPLARAVEERGAIRNADYQELAGELAAVGPAMRTYADEFKVQHGNVLQECLRHFADRGDSHLVGLRCLASHLCALSILTREQYDRCVYERVGMLPGAIVDAKYLAGSEKSSELEEDAYLSAAHLTYRALVGLPPPV